MGFGFWVLGLGRTQAPGGFGEHSDAVMAKASHSQRDLLVVDVLEQILHGAVANELHALEACRGKKRAELQSPGQPAEPKTPKTPLSPKPKSPRALDPKP